ncbi:unnamed protein product [Triticum turgidum subsp. durum]|uniref:F-box protein AT5G49610-like beta-propeller domain-containing protein n=1 Tax=Triticum turgidum subsp. durum TaxID=4567 RepID=A0A9R0YCV4_TRITD|nr:unnamed protein product [Triticum turgidum subsp. durum]
MCIASYILVFDSTTLSFSRIQYPRGMGFPKMIMLSQAHDDFGVYLICAEELQLAIWLYKGDSWLLVDTICLHEMYDDSRISHHKLVVRHKIRHVGVNAEFVLLELDWFVLYLDIKCRTFHKAYEMTIADRHLGYYIHPFMMIWPPTFPVLKCDPGSHAA